MVREIVFLVVVLFLPPSSSSVWEEALPLSVLLVFFPFRKAEEEVFVIERKAPPLLN